MRTPERYLALVTAGRSAEGGYEELDAEAQRVEGLQLSLRTGRGVPAEALAGEERDLDGLVAVRRRPAGADARRPAAGQRGRYPAALRASSGTGWGGGGPM